MNLVINAALLEIECFAHIACLRLRCTFCSGSSTFLKSKTDGFFFNINYCPVPLRHTRFSQPSFLFTSIIWSIFIFIVEGRGLPQSSPGVYPWNRVQSCPTLQQKQTDDTNQFYQGKHSNFIKIIFTFSGLSTFLKTFLPKINNLKSSFSLQYVASYTYLKIS